ncbi:MAG: ABC transporter permease [Alphaproteobacteria bacterium]|nr:ABC transporter permease [Alphaproteobacteria bacterium]MCB9931711.1 ABC transporter permease [Alphaproteobacteria bacterium]
MLRFTLRRLLMAILVAITVSVIAFFLVRVSGDVAIALAGEEASAEDIAEIRKAYGLDRPIIVQYADWLGKAVQGDFGQSLFFPETVWELVATRLPTTLRLAASGLVLSLLIGIPFGVLAALRPNSWIDRLSMTIAVAGQAIPTFWMGLMLMVVFGLTLGWTPISGDDSWQNFILPAVTLGYYSTPPIMRLTRSGMLEVLSADYIRTAYAKGLGPMRVLFKHALRNAVIPVVALASVQFGHMLSGAIVIESVFAMQGIGYLAWESILRKDIAVIQTILLVVCMFYVFLTVISDLLNAWLDPRIRVS